MEPATSPFHGASPRLFRAMSKDPDDFEFEPALHHHHQKLQKSSLCLEEEEEQQQQKLMSFADELFHSGYLLPLKLPPRLQPVRSADCSRRSSRAASPTVLSGSTTPWRRSPFARRSPKGEDADDPFAAALEKVRTEDCDAARRGRGSGRRTRSLSPNCWFGEQEKSSESASQLETRKRSGLDGDESMKKERSNVSAGDNKSRGRKERRGTTKNLLWMSSFSLDAKRREEARNDDGKWRDWIKEVFKATRKKPPLAKWHGPFLCFGHI